MVGGDGEGEEEGGRGGGTFSEIGDAGRMTLRELRWEGRRERERERERQTDRQTDRHWIYCQHAQLSSGTF